MSVTALALFSASISASAIIHWILDLTGPVGAALAGAGLGGIK